MQENFDISNWTLFSDRRNSKSYHSPDKKWMIKFNTDVRESSMDAFKEDQETTNKALAIGVKTPKVGEIVKTTDGKIGLIYEYIENKQSIARAISNDLENYDKYIKRFVNISKDLHSKVCDVNKFDNWEDRIKRNIEKFPIMTPENKKKAYELLDKIEKRNTCLHGDFQTGNFIITETEEYAIDLVGIAYGNPIYDIAVFYNFMHVMPTRVTEKVFHCEAKYFHPMWKSFVKYYFDVTDDNRIEEISNAMKKYSVLSFFAMFEKVDPSDDVPIFQKIYNEVFEDGLNYPEIINVK